MKLIAMTDYVKFIEEQGNINIILTQSEKHEKCLRYANFIKQPLTLGMFVPCDLHGNALEKPTTEDLEAYRKYQQANGRVVFKDCVYDHDIKTVRPPKEYADMFYNRKNDYDTKLLIEDVIKYNLTLTKNATKLLITKSGET